MMFLRGIIITALLFVSQVGDARQRMPDSLLTIQKAYRYNITSPDTAQAILAAIRERQAEPAWRIDFAEGDLNYNMRRYLKALPFYKRVGESPDIRDSLQVRMLLYKRMMDCYDALMLSDDLVKTVFSLKKMARSCRDKAFESMPIFTSGKTHHYHGQTDKGYSFCLEALEMMKETDYPNKHIELRNYYAALLKMYARDGRYEEAMNMSHHQEAEALYPSPVVILKARERGLRQVYALRASLLARAGRMDEADKAYAAWKEIAYSNAIDDMDIFDYLQLSHHSDEAHEIILRYREFISEQGDSVSFRMLSALNRDALLHMDMGEYDKAVICGRQVLSIADKLHITKSSEQLQTSYNLLQEQSASKSKTKMLMVLGLCIAIVVLVILVILYYVRYIRRRNRDLRHLINILDAYRRAVINGEPTTSPEVVAAIEELRSIQLPSDLSSEDEEPDDEDRRLFVEMDKQVIRDRLFLKPGLGREDLMRLIGVDKNRFGKMMSKYSDASNTSVYINTKRVEYGAKLLLEHPEYTIATVAAECGMSNTVTFNRTFKDMYQMTPSEYREKMTAI
jgi:AraC-like DNA-binding protein/tetratricopeptide (TPR) repeat protein